MVIKQIIFAILIVGFVIVGFVSVRGDTGDPWCFTSDTVIATSLPIDTLKGVAIYCTDTNNADTLPSWYSNIWSYINPKSIPRYYLETSFNKHKITIDPITKDAGHSFRSRFNIGRELDMFSCSQIYRDSFLTGIFKRVDSVVNFAQYDLTGPSNVPDTYVDCVFILILDTASCPGGGFFTCLTYNTNDSVGGVPIKIGGGSTTMLHVWVNRWVQSADAVSNLLIHEYGHSLGLPDMEHLGGGGYKHTALGSFDAMARPGFQEISSPFNPEFRKNLGWISHTSVNNSLFNQAIYDNTLSPTNVYKLVGPVYPDTQYFYISNHRQNGTWEQNWPDKGLMIWHVNKHVQTNSTLDWRYRTFKPVDLEVSSGLFDWNRNDPFDTLILASSPNPSYGTDSLDHRFVWDPFDTDSSQYQVQCSQVKNLGSKKTFWNDSTKTNFAYNTDPSPVYNPSADFYDPNNWVADTYEDGKRYNQEVKSHLAILNMRTPASESLAYANLIKNAWYGHIQPFNNVTWGPGTYTIVGDLTIDANASLTINSGTTIIFSANSDIKKAGVDTTKCEIVVNGTLNALGTQSDSILFVSSASSPSTNDWYGIIAKSGSTAKIKYSRIQNAYAGISYENSAADTVRNCLILSCKMYGVKNGNNNLVVKDNVIAGVGLPSGGYGISSTPNIKILRDSIKSCYYGVYTQGLGKKHWIEDCYFLETIFGQAGVFTDWGGYDTLRRNTFNGTFLTAAMRVKQAFAFYVDSSTVTGAHKGLLGENTALKMRRSTITGYDQRGVLLVTYGNLGVSPSDPGHNEIYTNYSTYPNAKAVQESLFAGNDSVKAELNWWGSNPPLSSYFVGKVDYSPYLTCPVAQGCPPGGSYVPFVPEPSVSVPEKFELLGNYPNPFNLNTEINYALPVEAHVKLVIYNTLGQKIRTLVNTHEQPGYKSVHWDGKNEKGEVVASGVYFYLLTAGEFKETKRMVLLK